MEVKKYTIKLSDGTELKDLTMNGNNYVSGNMVDESVFADNCTPMIITGDDGSEEILEHGVFEQQMEWPDGTWYLTFREKTPDEIRADRMQSQIDYIAMISDIDVEV